MPPDGPDREDLWDPDPIRAFVSELTEEGLSVMNLSGDKVGAVSGAILSEESFGVSQLIVALENQVGYGAFVLLLRGFKINSWSPDESTWLEIIIPWRLGFENHSV